MHLFKKKKRQFLSSLSAETSAFIWDLTQKNLSHAAAGNLMKREEDVAERFLKVFMS